MSHLAGIVDSSERAASDRCQVGSCYSIQRAEYLMEMSHGTNCSDDLAFAPFSDEPQASRRRSFNSASSAAGRTAGVKPAARKGVFVVRRQTEAPQKKNIAFHCGLTTSRLTGGPLRRGPAGST